jgi:tetratricopeptide (TPR) repeat protein
MKLATVRMSPGGYLAAAAVLTFAAVILLRARQDLTALLVVAATWIAVPLLIAFDRLNFDGEQLWRSGAVVLLLRLFRKHKRINIDHISRIDVVSLRTLRRGGNVRYRYRVEISAAEKFVFSSGGKRFRQMIKELLPQLPEFKLDVRARELRDHLIDNRTLNREVARLQIAPVAVLEATNEATTKEKRPVPQQREKNSADELERAVQLRKAANNLRVAGRLRESAEAFRRTFLITRDEGEIIYEYSRLLRSQASAFGDARLLSRARAALRLAVMRGGRDASLLEMIGESFLEFGEAARAARTFLAAVNINDGAYRARLGMAEVGLAQGKLAHVIHHYNEAARLAPDKSTRLMAQREAEYYARLNDDDDYLAAELRRMNWLEGADRVQRMTARLTFAALLAALIGPSIDPLIGGLAWALASSSVIAWVSALIVKRILSNRRRPALSDG